MESKIDEQIIDEQIEKLMNSERPQRSQEEIDEDVEFFVNHPINCRELTPEMLAKPEF